MLAYEWTFGSVLWAMVVFFFWFMLIWIFIVPFFGILIYMIARPKMTEQDKEMMAAMSERERRATGYSAADEVAKLAKLRDEGKITAEEYEQLKQQAMMQV